MLRSMKFQPCCLLFYFSANADVGTISLSESVALGVDASDFLIFLFGNYLRFGGRMLSTASPDF